MKNLMNVKAGEILNGKQINQWCEKYIMNQNAPANYRKEARRLFNPYLEDNVFYRAEYVPELIFKRV